MKSAVDTSGRVSPLVTSGRFFFRHRNGVFPLVLLALFAGFRPIYPYGNARLDTWLDLAGLMVAFTGQALRAAVIGYAYIQRGGKNRQVYANTLVTGGFFAHSRNPLYLGNLLVLLGLFILHNNPWVYALGMAFFLFAYNAIVAAEEAYLADRFGEEYAAYCRKANRWIPDFRGLRRSTDGMRFAWRRVLVKEYGSTYAWCATALLLLAHDRVAHSGFKGQQSYLVVIAALLVAATVTWAVVRHLKKSRRLAG